MAFAAIGTLSTMDTLKSNFQTVADFGEDRAFDNLSLLFDRHNALVNGMLDQFVDRTTERLLMYGGGALMAVEELDEFGTPHPQKIRPGSLVGFPLKLYGLGLQWTRKWFQNKTVAEWAGQVEGVMTADRVGIGVQIKKAIFGSTNYTTSDPLVDNLSTIPIPVKAMANADSAEIPPGPNGELFDGSTHTHYLATATLTAAGQIALITTVVEHAGDGNPLIYINKADEAGYRALTGFTAYLDIRLTAANNAVAANGVGLSPSSIYNRAIGIFNGAEVWVKPWVPANYQVCVMVGGQRPLMFRERNQGSGVLQLTFEDESYPLRARGWEREYGIGVYNRVAAAVNYSASGSYVVPTITTDLAP